MKYGFVEMVFASFPSRKAYKRFEIVAEHIGARRLNVRLVVLVVQSHGEFDVAPLIPTQ